MDWRKSSSSTTNANCVEVAYLACGWRKSGRSGYSNCVEVKLGGAEVAVRDSKHVGPMVVVPVAGWGELLRSRIVGGR